MKNTILFLVLSISASVLSQNAEIKPYVEHLNSIEKLSAKDYILQKFQHNDIVVLCERHHSEMTQYELIKEILSDDYFINNVGNLFTEVGVINLQPEITEFLKRRNQDNLYVEKQINEFHQNSSFWPIWERYSYRFLLQTIYNINNTSKNQISYYPSDVEFDWEKVKTGEDYKREWEIETEPRDSIIAFNIINQYEKIKHKKPKALVILNYRHAFKIHSVRSNGELQENAAKYLTDYFGDKMVSILLNTYTFIGNENDLVQKGKWDAAFKHLEMDNIGFDLKDSPFGNDYLDIWYNNEDSSVDYKDAFDGFVFYKSIEDHKLVEYFDGLASKDFEEELFRRYKIHFQRRNNEDGLQNLKRPEFKAELLKMLNSKKEMDYPHLEKMLAQRNKYFQNR